MRLGRAWQRIGALAASLAFAEGALAQERLTLEAYPADTPWHVVTDKDLGGRFYVELMPGDQTLLDYRDILSAASFPNVKVSAVEFLQGTLQQFQQAQSCEGLKLDPPTASKEQGRTVAYARAYCGQQSGQPFGVQIFYKAIEGADGIYVVNRDFRVPPSKVGGALSFPEGQEAQALALMKQVAAANAWLAKAVYLCGSGPADPRCSGPAPAGAQVLVSGQKLNALVASASYKATIQKAAATLAPEVVQGCSPAIPDRSVIRVLKPISFGADGRPFEGAWKQSVALDGCRTETVLNFLFTAGADERIRTLVLVPGSSIAEPQPQVEAFHGAVAAVQGLGAPCAGLHVANTRFEAFDHSRSPGPDPAPGAKVEIPWRETWTLVGCGKAWSMPMLFTPEGPATRVAAGQAVARP
jgi:hypothetical protein